MDSVIAALRAANEPVPRPLPLPTEKEIREAEEELNFPFPADFTRLQLGAGDVTFGTIEPVTISKDSGHTYIVDVARSAWSLGVPQDLLPICETNGDYYCLEQSGRIVFWSHDGKKSESWPSLAAWAREVWLGS